MLRTSMMLFALFLAADAGAQSAVKLKFTNDWRFEGHTAYLHLAKAKGYYEQEGLDVQIDVAPGSTAAIQRIVTGAYDIGFGDMSALIEYMGNNPGPQKLQAVYIKYDQLPLVYTSLKKTGIRSFADFQGKRIAAGTFESTRKLWPIVARAAKIDPASVSFVTVDPPLRVTMVIKGDADIFGAFYAVAIDWNQRGVKQEDIAVHPITDVGVRFYGNAVLASARLVNENPKALAAYLRAHNRAFKEGLADPAAAVKYLKQRDPLIDEALEAQRFVLMLPSMITDYTRANGLGAVDPALLQRQIDEVVAVFGVKSRPKAAELFTAEFLPPRAERMPLK